MMADLLDLAKFMNSLGNRIVSKANDAAITVTATIFKDVLQQTPVDTGTALSNWQVTLDQPATAVLPAWFPSPKGRVIAGFWKHKVDPQITFQTNAPATYDVARYVWLAKKPGQPIFITNNVDYIGDLNNGSSKQAPAGFVDRAKILGNTVAQKARII